MSKTKKNKSKIYFMCGDNESEDMVSDPNKMEYLINTKRCYNELESKEN
jgi:hypothetical protein